MTGILSAAPWRLVCSNLSSPPHRCPKLRCGPNNLRPLRGPHELPSHLGASVKLRQLIDDLRTPRLALSKPTIQIAQLLFDPRSIMRMHPRFELQLRLAMLDCVRQRDGAGHQPE